MTFITWNKLLTDYKKKYGEPNEKRLKLLKEAHSRYMEDVVGGKIGARIIYNFPEDDKGNIKEEIKEEKKEIKKSNIDVTLIFVVSAFLIIAGLTLK